MPAARAVWVLCLVPVCVFMAAVFFAPTIAFLSRSVLDPSPGLGHFRQLFTSPVYLAVTLSTARISAAGHARDGPPRVSRGGVRRVAVAAHGEPPAPARAVSAVDEPPRAELRVDGPAPAHRRRQPDPRRPRADQRAAVARVQRARRRHRDDARPASLRRPPDVREHAAGRPRAPARRAKSRRRADRELPPRVPAPHRARRGRRGAPGLRPGHGLLRDPRAPRRPRRHHDRDADRAPDHHAPQLGLRIRAVRAADGERARRARRGELAGGHPPARGRRPLPARGRHGGRRGRARPRRARRGAVVDRRAPRRPRARAPSASRPDAAMASPRRRPGVARHRGERASTSSCSPRSRS